MNSPNIKKIIIVEEDEEDEGLQIDSDSQG